MAKESNWSDEDRKKAVELYTSKDPVPETTIEVLNGVAAKMDRSPHGVRMILIQAGVYIAASSAAKKSTKKEGSAGARPSKQAAQTALINAIEAAGQEADTEIIEKLTGKAATYLTKVIAGITDSEDEDED